MPDKTISCHDCGKEFIFSGEEQSYYSEKGFQEPKRCKPCRMARKKRSQQDSIGNRKKSGTRGGQGGGGYNRW